MSYRSGRHNGELDLLVVRNQQMVQVNECPYWLIPENATQARWILVVPIQKRREARRVGRKEKRLATLSQ